MADRPGSLEQYLLSAAPDAAFQPESPISPLQSGRVALEQLALSRLLDIQQQQGSIPGGYVAPIPAWEGGGLRLLDQSNPQALALNANRMLAEAELGRLGEEGEQLQELADKTVLDSLDYIMQAPLTDALVVMSRAYLDAPGSEEEARAAAMQAGRDYLGEEGWNYLLPWLERPEMRSFMAEVPEIGPAAAMTADLLSGLVGVTDAVGDVAVAARVFGNPLMGRAMADVFDPSLGIIVPSRSAKGDPALRTALEAREVMGPGGMGGYWDDVSNMQGAMVGGNRAVIAAGPAELNLSASVDSQGIHVDTLKSRGDLDQAAAMRSLVPALYAADVNGVRVDTFPSAFGGPGAARMVTPQLRNTYNRLGFEFTPSGDMVRMPLPTDPKLAAVEQAAREARYENSMNFAVETGWNNPTDIRLDSAFTDAIHALFPDIKTGNYHHLDYRLDPRPLPGGEWDFGVLLPDGTRVQYRPSRGYVDADGVYRANAEATLQAGLDAYSPGLDVPPLKDLVEQAIRDVGPNASDSAYAYHASTLLGDELAALDFQGTREQLDSLMTAADYLISEGLQRAVDWDVVAPLPVPPKPSAIMALAQDPSSWLSKLSEQDLMLLRRAAGGSGSDEQDLIDFIQTTWGRGHANFDDMLRELARGGLSGSESKRLLQRLADAVGVQQPPAWSAPRATSGGGPARTLTPDESQFIATFLPAQTAPMLRDLTAAAPGRLDGSQVMARLLDTYAQAGGAGVRDLVSNEYRMSQGMADATADTVRRAYDEMLAQGIIGPTARSVTPTPAPGISVVSPTHVFEGVSRLNSQQLASLDTVVREYLPAAFGSRESMVRAIQDSFLTAGYPETYRIAMEDQVFQRLGPSETADLLQAVIAPLMAATP